MRVLHFGAGSIGRGFIGKVLADSGYHVTFVDVDQSIIKQINDDGYYQVKYIEKPERIFKVENVSALHAVDDVEQVIELVQSADLITTSTGVDNLVRLVDTLVKGLKDRTTPVDIICNENALSATDTLHDLIKQANDKLDLSLVGFLNSAIDRQAMNEMVDDKNIAIVEPFFEWVIEDNDLQNEVNHKIEGAHFVKDIKPFIERKLYIVNSEHAISAYLGHIYDKPTIQSVIKDDNLNKYLVDLLKEHAKYLQQEYRIDGLDEYINTTLTRHGNELLADDIYRVGRNPLRKLSNQERIVGPLVKLHEMNLDIKHSIKSVAIALSYRNPDDAEAVKLEEMFKTNSLNEVIKDVTGITNDSIVNEIAEIYNQLNGS